MPDLVGRLAAGDRGLVREAAVPLIAGGILEPGGSAIGRLAATAGRPESPPTGGSSPTQGR